MAETPWSIVLKEDGQKTLELHIYDVIGEAFLGGGVSAKQILQKLREAPKAKKIILRINSVGGLLDDAKAMVNLLRERAADGVEVEARVDGLAASAASYLTTAANHVVMPSNTFFMIHSARAGMRGTAEDMRKAGDLLETIDGQIAEAYAGASKRRGKKKTKADYLAMMAGGDRYLTADEAIEWGLADETDVAIDVAACAIDISSLADPPEALKTAPYVQRESEDVTEWTVKLIDQASGPAEKIAAAVDAATAALARFDEAQRSTAAPAATQEEPMTEQVTETKAQPQAQPAVSATPAVAAVEPTGFLAILGVSSEADGLAKVRELKNSALAILAATGKPTIAEAMPVIHEWKARSEQTDSLMKQVSQLAQRARVADRDAAIEKLTREGSLPPSRHAWAKERFQTAEDAETFCAGMTAGFWGSVTEPSDNAPTQLTDEQKTICKNLGLSEQSFLEQLKLDRTNRVGV